MATLAPAECSSVATISAVVDFPEPPFGLKNVIVDIVFPLIRCSHFRRLQTVVRVCGSLPA